MEIFGIILVCIVGIYILTSLRFPIVVWYHKHKLKKVTKYKNKDFANFYVLLPGLREQALVKDTIEYFNKMNYPKDKLHICIVTTQRENFEYQKKNIQTQTTQDLALKIIAEQNLNFETLNLHYPNNIGNKASQLNYAIKQILENYQTGDNCYFAMFDFDSRPDLNYFDLANKSIELNKQPDIVQSVPFFLYNIKEISQNPKHFVSVNFAMEQACRSGCVEIWNLLANAKRSIALFPLYAMGASLIVKKQTLIEQDYIPEPVDDLPLGFRYFINKKRFCYLPSIVLGDLPEKPKMFFNQAILIQKGNVMALKEAKRKGTAKCTLWRRFLVLCEFVSAFLFKFTIPLACLVYLILSCIFGFSWYCLAILLAPYLRFVSGTLVTTIFVKKKICFGTWLISFLLAFITPFCMGYGPAKNIWLETKKKLLKKDIVYKKTE
ncbi:MAG: glycosyltransferase family 2 protein [Clostridia bacterium]|nr:glycosyltransferase family 2 protein [Clostridia bacterium]